MVCGTLGVFNFGSTRCKERSPDGCKAPTSGANARVLIVARDAGERGALRTGVLSRSTSYNPRKTSSVSYGDPRKAMHLLFLDESGSLEGSKGLFGLGGCVVRD